MKQFLFAAMLALVTATIFSCNETAKNDDETMSSSNPFSSTSLLPYQAPEFDKIKDADFRPALLEGMKQHMKEIDSIANQTAEPTVENTLIAMEKSGQLLTRVRNVFDLFTGANTNPTLQKVQEEISPKLAAHADAIYLNEKLFKRVESIYNKKATLSLDNETSRLVDYTYEQFILAGAKLTEGDKDKLKKLNEEEASLNTRFTNRLLAAGKAGALVIDDTVELAGLSTTDKDAFAQKAKENKMEGKWMITLKNTTQQPSLQSLSNRATRQKLFEASWNRSEKGDSNDTRATLSRIAQLRVAKANLIGFDNYASWKLQDQMAKNTLAVDAFFAKLVPSVTAKANGEAADIQAVIDKQKGGFTLQPWDWDFYAEQVRKEKYDLNENEVKPYFELNKVLENGVFFAANQLYGLTFKERKDLPVYQKDVRVFEVFDKDSTSFALFYCDYYKRDNKSGGAWMSNMVGQSTLLGTKPVIYNVCNFTKPADGQPALISFDDVTTMFHEFGHALHGLFASQKYPSLSGTYVARDYVEFPSQFNEHWAMDPAVFKNYAIHYKTGEPMPQTLVNKIKKAASFNQGYKLTELLAAATLDMEWHKLTSNDSLQDVDMFEKKALEKTHLNLPQVPTRYRSSYFLHIWGNSYGAGYYAYVWTKMLEEDAFSWFEENGGMNRVNGQRFRDMILSKGNTEEYGKMFRDFRGHDPAIQPMQKALGLPVQ